MCGEIPTGYVGIPAGYVGIPAGYVGKPGSYVGIPAGFVGIPADYGRDTSWSSRERSKFIIWKEFIMWILVNNLAASGSFKRGNNQGTFIIWNISDESNNINLCYSVTFDSARNDDEDGSISWMYHAGNTLTFLCREDKRSTD